MTWQYGKEEVRFVRWVGLSYCADWAVRTGNAAAQRAADPAAEDVEGYAFNTPCFGSREGQMGQSGGDLCVLGIRKALSR